MPYSCPQIMKTLYSLGSKSGCSPQTQIQLALNYCSNILDFENYIILDLNKKDYTINYFPASEPQIIIKDKNRETSNIFSALSLKYKRDNVFSEINSELKITLDQILNCTINYGIFFRLQNNININRFLVFFLTSDSLYQLAKEKLNERIELISPYISYLLDRRDFKKILDKDKIRLQKTLKEASLPMAMLDKEMKFITYNKAWLIQNEIKSANIIGQSLTEAMSNFPESWKSLPGKCLEGKIELCRDDMYLKKDGSKCYLRWTASPYFDLIGKLNGIILTTDSNAELAEKRDLALNASKMKTDFLAHMSHEIRTPLNGIICIADLLLNADLNTKQNELAKMIKACSDTLHEIVTEVLDLSKIESGAIELDSTPFSLSDLIEETKSIYLPLIQQKGLSFHIDQNISKESIFFGDPTKIRQVLFNLLSNALKFTEKGIISFNCNEDDLSNLESQITFNIIDSGIGIAESKLNSLFAPFKQADISITRKYGGCGLGLYISKRLAELMNGEITVQSQFCLGSNFTFSIPLKHSSRVKSDALNNVKTYSASIENRSTIVINPDVLNIFHNKPAILLVDDNLINRKVIFLYLQRLGLTADMAKNGLEAIHAYTNKHYDLILMDCQMDGMDGYTAAKKIRELEILRNEIKSKIVAVTANASIEDKTLCIASGMDDYLPKPIKYNKFREMIENHLH